jgi:hypothetical protein
MQYFRDVSPTPKIEDFNTKTHKSNSVPTSMQVMINRFI